nr:hypothetical protein [Amycolatopsis nivea]
MFAEYLAGVGDRVIARGLNQDGIPCPSKARPEQNRHTSGGGLAGLDCPGDPGESQVHGLCGIRAVDEA